MAARPSHRTVRVRASIARWLCYGALLTYLIAILSAALTPDHPATFDVPGVWKPGASEDWRAPKHSRWRTTRFVDTFESYGDPLDDPVGRPFQQSVQSGWPFRAVRSSWSGILMPLEYRPPCGPIAGVSLPVWWQPTDPPRYRRIPLVPMPIGFALNSIILGGLAALIVEPFLSLIRVLRRRRHGRRIALGLCPTCKHPGFSPTSRCAECGGGVPVV
jgi:hypothetical protein